MSSNRVYKTIEKEISKQRAAEHKPELSEREDAHLLKEAKIMHAKNTRLSNFGIHKQQEIKRARAEKQEHLIRFTK